MHELLVELKSRGINLSLDGGAIRVGAPNGVMSDELRERIRRNREDLLTLLRSEE